MALQPIFENVAVFPHEYDTCPSTTRGGLRVNIQDYLNFMMPPGDVSGDDEAQMRYTPRCYAFKSVSEIRGGVPPLLELHRRWNLPDGHKDKLRIERATPEDIENARRDPDSVHPNLKLLEEDRKAAAELAAERAAEEVAGSFIPSFTWHPVDLRFVGLDLIPTQPGPSSTKRPRGQRIDTGRRRARASDNSPWVQKKRPMRGITSMRSVIPGVDETSGGGGRAAKRARLDDCAVEDRIEDLVLSVEFGGPLRVSV